MPQIRISNGDLFDPWKPGLFAPTEPDSWDWLGHHLANECRYAGGCKWYYSVAQHSVLASRYVEKYRIYGHGGEIYESRKLQLAALLHDATEATLKDIPGPYKHSHTRFALGYNAVEKDLAAWIYEQFGLGKEYLDAPSIKAIDKELLDAERHVLFPDSGYTYSGSVVVEPWDREYARDEFNQTLRSLWPS